LLPPSSPRRPPPRHRRNHVPRIPKEAQVRFLEPRFFFMDRRSTRARSRCRGHHGDHQGAQPLQEQLWPEHPHGHPSTSLEDRLRGCYPLLYLPC
jgi:hypothetical protein